MSNTERLIRRFERRYARQRRREMRFARWHGFFWMECILCGFEFGGHEWRDMAGKSSAIPDPSNPTGGKGICPCCTQAGRGTW